MEVHTGRSRALTPTEAVLEATAGWPQRDPEVVFAFLSSLHDVAALALALRARFVSSRIVGSTSAGELVDGVHDNGTLVLGALYDTGIRWAVGVVRDLTSFDAAAAGKLTAHLLSELEVTRDAAKDCFVVALVDGLDPRAPWAAAHVSRALPGASLVGGGAGDDLRFRMTHVLAGAEVIVGGAVFLAGYGPGRFQTFRHQHVVPGNDLLRVTRADPARAIVYELDGMPAIEAYARAFGRETVDLARLGARPPVLHGSGDPLVRAVRHVDQSGAFHMFVGVEEGATLSIGVAEEMVGALARDLAAQHIEADRIELFLGFHCALRSFESTVRGCREANAWLWRGAARHSIGFDTYCELVDDSTRNVTLVALALLAAR